MSDDRELNISDWLLKCSSGVGIEFRFGIK